MLQIGEMNATGYAVLSKRQLRLIYGQRSPYYHPVALKRLSKLLDQNDGIQKSLESELKKLAKLIILFKKFQLIKNVEKMICFQHGKDSFPQLSIPRCREKRRRE